MMNFEAPGPALESEVHVAPDTQQPSPPLGAPMNGSPSRTRSSFEFWFAIGFASFFAEPSVDEIPGDA